MKDINFLTQKPIAHRGLHNTQSPENSLSAFLRAVVEGYPIELDVQLTADNKLIIFHDWNLDRMTKLSGKINKKKYIELEQVFLNDTKEKIPLLKDVFQLVGGRVPIIIEIKQKGFNFSSICNKLYEEINNYSGTVAVSSFNPFIVKWWRKNAPDIVRGQNFTNFKNNNIVVSWVKRISLYTGWIISNNKPNFFAIRAQMLPDCFPARSAKKYKKLIFTYDIKDHSEYARIRNSINNEFFDGKPYINN